eukprot:12903447-Prorocentrum_lima.AAC.1
MDQESGTALRPGVNAMLEHARGVLDQAFLMKVHDIGPVPDLQPHLAWVRIAMMQDFHEICVQAAGVDG